jgi:hypothetical protein
MAFGAMNRYPVEPAGTAPRMAGHTGESSPESDMDGPDPKETKGVPWADHNETESTPEDTRREEYSEADPNKKSDDPADHRSGTTDLPTDEDRGDVEQDL